MEIDAEAIWEVENQFGDTPPVQTIQVGLSTENIGQEEEEDETEIIWETDNQSRDTVFLEKLSSLEGEIINEIVSRTVPPLKKYRAKLKKLRK